MIDEQNTDKPDWPALVFDSKWLARLDALAMRRFADAVLAEEAAAHVIEKLSENNWQRCAAFEGRAKADTYLYSLASTLLEEFSRQRFGRPRPPTWLKKQGQLWVDCWKRVCLERLPEAVVADCLAGSARTLAAVKEVIREIKARIPNCGVKVRNVSDQSQDNSDEASTYLLDSYFSHHSPEEQGRLMAFHETLRLFFQFFFDKTPDEVATSKLVGENDVLSSKLVQLQSRIQLDCEEQLILKMVYQDGMKKNVVASALGMKTHQPGRIIANTLNKIRSVMEELGLGQEYIASLLDVSENDLT